MKNAFYLILGIVILGIACGNAVEVTAVAQDMRHPVDSTAKADSILKLKYNKTNWSISIKELARWDSCKARQIDSVIMFIIKLPSNWAGTRDAIFGLDSLAYGQIYSYGRKVGDDYYTFLRNPPPPPIPIIEPRDYIMTEKPVIYLYPTEDMLITVQIALNGKFGFTWPKMQNGNEWVVKANQTGMLTDADGQEYPYLFWDGVQNNMAYINHAEGFIVKGAEVSQFLTDKLTLLGFNARERADFITYWAPRMLGNEYNFVRFETTEYNNAVPLTITPKPESIQRVLMVVKPVDKNYNCETQQLLPFTRKGYTVIEWGGIEMPVIVN